MQDSKSVWLPSGTTIGYVTSWEDDPAVWDSWLSADGISTDELVVNGADRHHATVELVLEYQERQITDVLKLKHLHPEWNLEDEYRRLLGVVRECGALLAKLSEKGAGA